MILYLMEYFENIQYDSHFTGESIIVTAPQGGRLENIFPNYKWTCLSYEQF